MNTAIVRIRAKIAEFEAKLADLRIAERELLALETVSLRTTASLRKTTSSRKTTRLQKKGAKRGPKPKHGPEAIASSPKRQTSGEAIAEVLGQHGALSVPEIAGHIKAAGRDIDRRAVSYSLQAMKKQRRVKTSGGKWTLAKASASKLAVA